LNISPRIYTSIGGFGISASLVPILNFTSWLTGRSRISEGIASESLGSTKSSVPQWSPGKAAVESLRNKFSESGDLLQVYQPFSEPNKTQICHRA